MSIKFIQVALMYKKVYQASIEYIKMYSIKLDYLTIQPSIKKTSIKSKNVFLGVKINLKKSAFINQKSYSNSFKTSHKTFFVQTFSTYYAIPPVALRLHPCPLKRLFKSRNKILRRIFRVKPP